MNRKEKIIQCFDNRTEISLQNQEYVDFVKQTFKNSLNNDIKSGDASQLPRKLYQYETRANIIAKQTGIIGGLEEIVHILKSFELNIETFFEDGERIDNNEIMLTISGKISQLLKLERTILNFLQRLCGIATKTKKFADQINHTDCFVIGTRKTIWGMWDKKAVQCGNGLSHRIGLYDAAMLKENHLKILKQENGFQAIKSSIENIIETKNPRFIEVEVTSLREFRKISELLAGIDDKTPKVIMFDHFSPTKIKGCLEEAQENKQYDKIFFEASGNITLDNIRDYAEAGVDVISSGALTHSVKSLDLSMLF